MPRVISKEHQLLLSNIIKTVFDPSFERGKSHKLAERIRTKWKIGLKRFLPLHGSSFGNQLKLFSNGSDAFKDIWSNIRKAKQRVWIETYIFEPDHVGQQTLDALIEACRSGCDVQVLCDSIGSSKLYDAFWTEYRAAGGLLYMFNPLLEWPWRYQYWGLLRNHAKLIVIDSDLGYCGGMNIGDDYAEKDVGGTGMFRDTHVRVQGPAVKDLMNVFISSVEGSIHASQRGNWLSTLSEKAKKAFSLHSKESSETESASSESFSSSVPSGAFVQVLESNIKRDCRHIQKALRMALRNACSHCCITSAYFLPAKSLGKAIIEAARRGVDVRLLTAPTYLSHLFEKWRENI